MPDEIDNNKQYDLDDEQDDSGDEQEHFPTAPYLQPEKLMPHLIICSNIYPPNNDLFKGQYFAYKQTTIIAIKANHIKILKITML